MQPRVLIDERASVQLTSGHPLKLRILGILQLSSNALITSGRRRKSYFSEASFPSRTDGVAGLVDLKGRWPKRPRMLGFRKERGRRLYTTAVIGPIMRLAHGDVHRIAHRRKAVRPHKLQHSPTRSPKNRVQNKVQTEIGPPYEGGPISSIV